jgi:hypothetical protein
MSDGRPYAFSPRNQAMVLRYLLSRVRGRPVTIKALAQRYGVGQKWAGQLLNRWICRLTDDPWGDFRWATVDGERQCVRNPVRRAFKARLQPGERGRAFVRALWAGNFIARPAQTEISP